MHRCVPLRLSMFCLPAFLALSIAARAQSNPAAPGPDAPTGTNAASGGDVRILYTGKMLGYFRARDWQGPKADGSGCGGIREQQSIPARDFETAVGSSAGAILIGTGDNFAPEIEGREFCISPAPSAPKNGKPQYSRLGKELFFWDTSLTPPQWVAFDAEDKQKGKEKHKKCDFTSKAIDDECGTGLIPYDNVAQFFINAGYAAIIPGKHDFFFGPERLRQLARYLASAKMPENRMVNDGHVQMLGANLVIETSWRSGHAPLPDKEVPPWFIPRFPAATDFINEPHGRNEARLEMRLIGLSDGATVYPWFQGPLLTISQNERRPELVAMLRQSLSLCQATDPGMKRAGDQEMERAANPNHIPESLNDCQKATLYPEGKNDEGEYRVRFSEKAFLFTPGQNYALCSDAANSSATDRNGGHRFCVRFSVYRPFFQHPWNHTAQTCPVPYLDGNCYQDPKPYVLLEANDANKLAQDVAIFGILDPGMGEHIGMLNFSWQNAKDEYKTRTAIKEPAEAISELVEYFEQKYRDTHNGNAFRGIKVLLAQMTPQQTQVLALRLKGFQVAVSAADEEMATVGDDTRMTWNAARARRAGVDYPRLLAVPAPYYTHRNEAPQWVVDVGLLRIQTESGASAAWNIESRHLRQPSQLRSRSEATEFWAMVESVLDKKCLPPTMEFGSNRDDNIRYFTLCAMQHFTGADVALLQKRDFFTDLPRDTGDIGKDLANDPALQQILDRIVWKGDLVTLLYVPGSAIKSAMDNSKNFDAADRSKLSLPGERDRGLVALGVVYDAERKEYIINGLPLDPNKLYAVATSDYIGAGDTGYPSLAAAQLSPPVTPSDFDSHLNTIASIVCRELVPEHVAADCLQPLRRDDYFDRLAGVEPNDPRQGSTPARQFWMWSIFHHPAGVPGETARHESASDGAQRRIEQRSIWDFAVQKWSVGITTVGHNGTDFDVQNNFSGITTPGVNAFRSTSITSDFQAQWTRSWHSGQFFIAPAYSYNVQDRGQPDNFRVINQVADLGMIDVGYVYRLGQRRQVEEFDAVISHHFETPLTQAFNSFTLSTTHLGQHGEPVADQIRFELDRSYTELVRPGVRWRKRISSVELGPQWGHEWNALREIDFTTGKFFTACPATAAAPISQCIKSAIKANSKSITSASVVTTQRSGQNHAGVYWKLNLTVPFHPRVAYVLTDGGDWFFVHYAAETSTTTWLRDLSQHQLRFTIFPSFSIGPELDLLLYQNKSVGTLKGHFLRQDQLIMKAQFSFDWFNRRGLSKQIQYSPPRSGK